MVSGLGKLSDFSNASGEETHAGDVNGFSCNDALNPDEVLHKLSGNALSPQPRGVALAPCWRRETGQSFDATCHSNSSRE